MARSRKQNKLHKNPPNFDGKAITRYVSLKKLFAFFVGSGLLVVLYGATYQHFVGNVSLEFIQSVGRAYEFQFKNDTPSDRTLKTFRIELPRVQRVVFKISDNLPLHVNSDGQLTLPGGNLSYVPATEFKELDGQRLQANSSLKFRIPPLSSRSWMVPEATIVDVHYELESSNSALWALEEFLSVIGIQSSIRTNRYLVVDNYWTLSQSTSIDEAIRIFCRDNEDMSKSSTCSNVH
ncbi:hypothetical protein [Rheinheimera texasensis]|uniref:hypothetical protein n=1 Tax=Rheinheimera texasensis TaxID=306205 RepID=UPI0032B17A7E